MNYELAKKLKEAGLPQKPQNAFSSNQYFNDDDGEYYLPNLGELIEACGDRFRTLIYCGCEKCKWNVHGDEEIDGWNEKDDWRGSFNGSTPEEAVAELWLKLNKK